MLQSPGNTDFAMGDNAMINSQMMSMLYDEDDMLLTQHVDDNTQQKNSER